MHSVDVEQLRYELCVEVGFCLDPEPHQALIDNPPSGVEEFTDAVIRAEGREPQQLRPNIREQVRVRVERAFN